MLFFFWQKKNNVLKTSWMLSLSFLSTVSRHIFCFCKIEEALRPFLSSQLTSLTRIVSNDHFLHLDFLGNRIKTLNDWWLMLCKHNTAGCGDIESVKGRFFVTNSRSGRSKRASRCGGPLGSICASRGQGMLFCQWNFQRTIECICAKCPARMLAHH